MQVYGNGVTRNFLQILEADLQRAARGLALLVLLTCGMALAAFFALHRELWPGFSGFAALLILSFASGVLWARLVQLRRYERSIRDHWNRWMRYSVSCVTVRECYTKVHGKAPGPSPWWTGLVLALLLLSHLVLGVLALNAAAHPTQALPLFGLDAILLGFFAGSRLVQRLWYQRFLQSVNEMLREGTLGIWGVY